MSREELVRELVFIVRAVAGRELAKWSAPPGVFFARAALKFETCILEGIFGYQRSITDIGVGKSVYALKTLYHVYGKNWDLAKQYVVFMPQEFIRVFEWAVDNGAKIPALLWDDAGMWVGRLRWQNEFVKTVKEFLNVVRTHVAYIAFTAPTAGEIARGIRERIKVYTFIRRIWSSPDLRKAVAQASYYTLSMLEEKRGKGLPEPLATYYFRLYFEHYPEYKEKRDQYVRIGLGRMKEKLKYIAERAAEELREVMKKVEEGRRVEPLVEPESIELGEEELEAEELEEGEEDGG